MNKFRSRAPETVLRRKTNLHRFKCALEYKTFGDFISGDYSLVHSSLSPLTCLKRSRETQRWLAANTLTTSNMQRHNQQLFTRKFPFIESNRIRFIVNNRRLLTTKTKENRKSGRNTRKKKALLQPSKKLTTKDRLRLSSRPSSSAKKNNESNNHSMIESPEELMERLHSGLDIARTAVKEGYASLRNPTNAGDKNHLLPARPAPGGRTTSEGSRPIPSEGLVMDANWWFWNILFAASPAMLIAVYCQFIVKPQMKLRYEEKEREEKDAASKGNKKVDNNKTSSMRIRVEEQKKKEQEVLDSTTTDTRNSSSTPVTSRSNLAEGLSSYSRFLASWLSGEQSLPIPASNDDRYPKNGTRQVEKNVKKSTKEANEAQEQQQNETISLETQQQKLKELETKIQILQEKLLRQQYEPDDSKTGNNVRGAESGDSCSNRGAESSLSSIGKLAKGMTEAGVNIGKERWRTFWFWLQYRDQSSDDTSSKALGGADIAATSENGSSIVVSSVDDNNNNKPDNEQVSRPSTAG